MPAEMFLTDAELVTLTGLETTSGAGPVSIAERKLTRRAGAKSRFCSRPRRNRCQNRITRPR